MIEGQPQGVRGQTSATNCVPPITNIHGYVDGMLDGTIPADDFPKYLRIVSDETTRMKSLITDLLELSRMEDGVATLDQQEYNLNESIRRVLIGQYERYR